MKNLRIKKTNILITVYIVLIIIELFFCVPYHNIQIFRSQQYVPHTVIVGSGYASMTDIKNDKACTNEKTPFAPSEIGKTVNTPQIFLNVSITTVLAIVAYFLMQKEEGVNEMPILDVNNLAFATEEEIEQAQRDYAKEMAEYVKRNKL